MDNSNHERIGTFCTVGILTGAGYHAASIVAAISQSSCVIDDDRDSFVSKISGLTLNLAIALYANVWLAISAGWALSKKLDAKRGKKRAWLKSVVLSLLYLIAWPIEFIVRTCSMTGLTVFSVFTANLSNFVFQIAKQDICDRAKFVATFFFHAFFAALSFVSDDAELRRDAWWSYFVVFDVYLYSWIVAGAATLGCASAFFYAQKSSHEKKCETTLAQYKQVSQSDS